MQGLSAAVVGSFLRHAGREGLTLRHGFDQDCVPTEMNSSAIARKGRRPWIVLTVLFGLMALVWLAARPVVDAIDAALVLIGTGEGPGVRDLNDFEREGVTWQVGSSQVTGDLYRSQAVDARPLLLIYGAAVGGKDDPRLVAFAETFSRAGFSVLVPEIPSMRNLQLGPENIVDIANAARYFPSCRSAEGPAIAIIAVSYAVGPAILAAQEDAMEDCIAFLVGIGGYYDLTEAATFFITGYFREAEGEDWIYRAPNVFAKWIFVFGNTDRIESESDRDLISEIAIRKLEDIGASIDDLVVQLGPEGRAVIELITNEDPELNRSLFEHLPAGILEDIAALNMAGRDITRPRAPMILIHGRDDPIFPYSQTLALARARGDSPVDVYLIDNLAHVDLQAGGLVDSFKLWRVFYRILSLR